MGPAARDMADDDKLTTLYRTYGPMIYSRCRRLLRDDAAAEDATQETFMRVHRHLEKAPDSREALFWIYRIATNYCLNELRDRRQRPELQAELPELPSGDIETLLGDRDLVARLVARSPAETRAAAWLHHVDGLDQAEVGQVLGVSRRTVVNRLAEFARNAQKFVRRTAV
jgi:RNA polymerase sigma-70 factor (ECF subfamily)